MHTHLLGRPEHPRHECRLHHGLAAREGDAAFRGFEQVLVPFDLDHHGIEVHRLAVAHLPGVGVLAVLAAQWAAAQEYRHAGARAVHRRIDVPGMHKTYVAGFQRIDAVTPIESDGRFES